jgi:hypothetical protein
MTTDRQAAANRRNALLSTGPRTRLGKHRSRRNALRHGLTAETLIATLEDEKEYRAFERSVLATYSPATAVGRELSCRLASLLWRLRRATAIETGLFSIQAGILHERRQRSAIPSDGIARTVQQLLISAQANADGEALDRGDGQAATVRPNGTHAAHCFLRLANLNKDAFERIGRYEAMLWKQVAQTVFLLGKARL